jgi:hypothetical protein
VFRAPRRTSDATLRDCTPVKRRISLPVSEILGTHLTQRSAAAWMWGAMSLLACNAPSRDGLFSVGGVSARGGSAGEGNQGGAVAGGAGGRSSGGAAGRAGTAVAGAGGQSAAGAGGAGAGGENNGDAGVEDPPDTGLAQSDAGDDDDDDDDTPVVVVPSGPLCQGTLFDDICWYLGPEDQSCEQACGEHGGYDAAATAVIGTTAQGGDLGRCSELFDLLLGEAEDPVVLATQIEGVGVGCHLFADVRWWLEAPPFSPAQSLVGGRLVCGCNE